MTNTISKKGPAQKIFAHRTSIPAGYLLGRQSAGNGDVELIPIPTFPTVAQVANTTIPTGAATSGDVSGNLPGPLTVKGLQGIPISTDTPTMGQVLEYDGVEWEPTTLAAPATARSLMPLVNGDLPGPAPIADGRGQYIGVPV